MPGIHDLHRPIQPHQWKSFWLWTFKVDVSSSLLRALALGHLVTTVSFPKPVKLGTFLNSQFCESASPSLFSTEVTCLFSPSPRSPFKGKGSDGGIQIWAPWVEEEGCWASPHHSAYWSNRFLYPEPLRTFFQKPWQWPDMLPAHQVHFHVPENFKHT